MMGNYYNLKNKDNLEGFYAKRNKSEILSEGLVMPRREKEIKYPYIIGFFPICEFVTKNKPNRY